MAGTNRFDVYDRWLTPKDQSPIDIQDDIVDYATRLAKGTALKSEQSKILAQVYWGSDASSHMGRHNEASRVFRSLEQEFPDFATEVLRNATDNRIPHMRDFLVTIHAQMKKHGERVLNGTYCSAIDKRATIESRYAECVLRMLSRHFRMGSAISEDDILSPWLQLNSGATLGDKVYVWYHTVMMYHAQECRYLKYK